MFPTLICGPQMKGKKARGPESELSVEAAARKEKLLALNRKWMSFVMICSDRGIFAWIESIDAADHVRSVCSLLWSAAVGNICLSRIKRCCRFMNVCYDGQQQWNIFVWTESERCCRFFILLWPHLLWRFYLVRVFASWQISRGTKWPLFPQIWPSCICSNFGRNMAPIWWWAWRDSAASSLSLVLGNCISASSTTCNYCDKFCSDVNQ